MAKWEYIGPVYYCGNQITPRTTLKTTADTFGKARSNILYKAANGATDIGNYDIDYSEIICVEDIPAPTHSVDCPECGTTLTDMGECPVCKWGDNND